MVEEKEIDVFDVPAEILVHQTNCMGVMGAGIALQIRKRCPDVYEAYRKLCKKKSPTELLGHIFLIPVQRTFGPQYICNLFGQKDVAGSGGGCMTDYDAVAEALRRLHDFASEEGIVSITLPYGIGCGLGGGDWERVYGLIDEEFAADKAICVVVAKKAED